MHLAPVPISAVHLPAPTILAVAPCDRGSPPAPRQPRPPAVVGAGAGRQGTNAQLPAVPAYRLHRAKKLAYVRLDRRMIYLGRADSVESRERYRRVVSEWLSTGRAPRPAGEEEPGRWTVDQLVDAHLRWARGYYLGADGKPSSGLGPVEAAAKILCALYGSTPASTFGPVALRAVRQAMITDGLCRNVVNQRIARIKRIFRWGVAEELVPPAVLQALAAVDPLRSGRSGARETPPVGPVPDAHVDAILPFLPPTLRAMVRLQRLTGMRSGELCRMRPCDIDRSNDVWIYRPSSHKTSYRGHERLVYLGPQARVELKSLLEGCADGTFVFSPRQALAERRALRRAAPGSRAFTSRSVAAGQGGRAGDRYNPRSFRRSLAYAMDAAIRAGALTAEQRWHPHQLRHRHATAIRQSKGLEAARVLLGHRTLAQTVEYAAVDRASAMAMARELA